MEVWGAQHLLLSARQNQVLSVPITGGNLWSLCSPFPCFMFFSSTTHGNRKPPRLKNTDIQLWPLTHTLFGRDLPIMLPWQNNFNHLCFPNTDLKWEYQGSVLLQLSWGWTPGCSGSWQQIPPCKTLYFPTPCNYLKGDTENARGCAPRP